MGQRDTFTFDDILSSDYDVYILDAKLNNTPDRDVSTQIIPGRNGEVRIDNGRYSNIEIPYTCAIVDNADTQFDGLSAALLSKIGYKRLEDSLHPEYYRVGSYIGLIEPTMFDRRNKGVFELRFNCKPQKYLKSGEKEVSVSDTAKFFNPTLFASRPLIKVSGTGTISMGGSVVTVAQNPGNMVIDCEAEDVYSSVTKANYNSYVTLTNHKFPEIPSGESNVTVSGNISAVVIPRWWTV